MYHTFTYNAAAAVKEICRRMWRCVLGKSGQSY